MTFQRDAFESRTRWERVASTKGGAAVPALDRADPPGTSSIGASPDRANSAFRCAAAMRARSFQVI